MGKIEALGHCNLVHSSEYHHIINIFNCSIYSHVSLIRDVPLALHDLVCLASRQLRHVGDHACVGGEEILGGLHHLVRVLGRRQQLGRAVAHPDLVVNLLLQVLVLVTMVTEADIKNVDMEYV